MSGYSESAERGSLCGHRGTFRRPAGSRISVRQREGTQLDRNVPLIAVVLGAALFITIWIAVSLILSFVGGWRALAREYRAPHPVPDGAWVERRVLFSGSARYKNVLRLRANDAGIFISVAPMFRIGHPPLFLPWEDLFTMPSGSAPAGYTEIRFRRVSSPRMLVSDSTLQRLDESAPRPWHAA
ncbi:MAG: hypothetical protein ACR2QM_12085 [Longimicrobiales bacterium]